MLRNAQARLFFLTLIWIPYLTGSVNAAETTLVINELMAANNTTIQDQQGQYDDWIEIYNYGANAIDMGGMYLTDNLSDTTKWLIPANNPADTTIPAGGFLLIWADNDTTDAGLHANFKLGAGGEEIGLFDSNGITLIDSITFGNQVTDISYGRYPDAGEDWRLFTSPSPAAQNEGGYLGEVADTKFSHNRGFYVAHFSVTIATETGLGRTGGPVAIEQSIVPASSFTARTTRIPWVTIWAAHHLT